MITRSDFIARAKAAATAALELGSPIVPSIAAAQAALESRYGQSQLALRANNLLGIKASRKWTGDVIELPTLEWSKGDFITVSASWRRYPSWLDCFLDYGSIISRLSWYADAAEAAKHSNARGFLDGLVAKKHGPGEADDEPGWATDPAYREKVWQIAKQWGMVE